MTPNDTHHRFAAAALDAGLDVICDKPVTHDLVQAIDLAARARDDRLKPDDIQGGTFSITNAGVYGAINSSPVINVPEVAILLVGRARKLPVVIENDQIAVRLVMPLSLSYDHRVVELGLALGEAMKLRRGRGWAECGRLRECSCCT